MIKLVFSERFDQVKIQFLATALANVLCLAQGCAVGWLSPSLPVLLSDDSPLASGPLSLTEAGWIASLIPAGAFFGTIFFGLLANYAGSKLSLITCSLPASVSWVIVLFAERAWHITLSRFLSGLTGGGVFICISLFIAEIAEDHIRGLLSSLLTVSYTAGIMLGYVGGAFIQYEMQPYAIMSLLMIFLVTFVFLPNSPQQFLKYNKTEEAQRSLWFYRNYQSNSTKIRKEAVEIEFEKFAAIAKQNELSPSVTISDFLTKEAIRGFIVCPVLLAVSQLSGTFTMVSYAAMIFKESGSTINPNHSAIVLGCVQLGGTCISMGLIDRIGRKILLLISTLGSAVSLVITGVYSYYNQLGYDLSDYSVLPVMTLSVFIFVSSLGIIPIPFVLLTEMMPQKIRRIGATICTCSVGLFSFGMLKVFPVMLKNIDLYGCLWFFSLIAFMGFVFTLIVVEETKGKNLDRLDENA